MCTHADVYLNIEVRMEIDVWRYTLSTLFHLTNVKQLGLNEEVPAAFRESLQSSSCGKTSPE